MVSKASFLICALFIAGILGDKDVLNDVDSTQSKDFYATKEFDLDPLFPEQAESDYKLEGSPEASSNDETEIGPTLTDTFSGNRGTPCYRNVSSDEIQKDCQTEEVEPCEDIFKDECITALCQNVTVVKSKTIDEQVCKNITRDFCVGKPTEVCEDKNVPLNKTILEKVCKKVPKPNCEKSIKQECIPVEEEVCKPEEVVVQVPRVEKVCYPVNGTRCSQESRRGCRNIEVPVQVRVPSMECKPVEKKVCQGEEISKEVCHQVPKDECKPEWSREGEWVASTECDSTNDCSLKWSGSPSRIFRRSPCNSSPKCWLVKRWVEVPAWKNVCKKVWVTECRNVLSSQPKCQSVSKEDCIQVEKWATLWTTKEECTDPPIQICKNEERQECRDAVKTVSEKRIEQKCSNMTSVKCHDVETCQTVFMDECSEIERHVEVVDVQKLCREETVAECSAVIDEECKNVTRIILEDVPEMKCEIVCRQVTTRVCKMEPKCINIRVDVVRQVEEPCDRNQASTTEPERFNEKTTAATEYSTEAFEDETTPSSELSTKPFDHDTTVLIPRQA